LNNHFEPTKVAQLANKSPNLVTLLLLPPIIYAGMSARS
jgi:hypothetical protein